MCPVYQLLIFVAVFLFIPHVFSCSTLCFQLQIRFCDKQTLILACRRNIIKCCLDYYLRNGREWKESGLNRRRSWVAMQSQKNVSKSHRDELSESAYSIGTRAFIPVHWSILYMSCSLGEHFSPHLAGKKIILSFLRGFWIVQHTVYYSLQQGQYYWKIWLK